MATNYHDTERATPHDADTLALSLNGHHKRQVQRIAAAWKDDKKRLHDLTEAFALYAREYHTASTEPSHNRLEFEDCDHPLCVNARAILASKEQS